MSFRHFAVNFDQCCLLKSNISAFVMLSPVIGVEAIIKIAVSTKTCGVPEKQDISRNLDN